MPFQMTLHYYISDNIDDLNIVSCLTNMSKVKGQVCCKVFKELYGNNLSEIICSSLFSAIKIDQIIAKSYINDCFFILTVNKKLLIKYLIPYAFLVSVAFFVCCREFSGDSIFLGGSCCGETILFCEYCCIFPKDQAKHFC